MTNTKRTAWQEAEVRFLHGISLSHSGVGTQSPNGVAGEALDPAPSLKPLPSMVGNFASHQPVRAPPEIRKMNVACIMSLVAGSAW